MAYCTPEDVSEITGVVYDEKQTKALARWLDAIEIIIDDTIEAYGKEPALVSLARKKMVSEFMGEKAANAFGIDPTVVSQSLASGDTSESETRIATDAIFSRITFMEPGYLKLLGLKNLQIVSAPTVTRW